MRKSIIKRASAVVCALALTIASTATCFADWTSYFGMNMGWYEGSLGELKSSSATGWEAFLEQIGWGGVWGAQIKDEAITVEAGKEYQLSFDIVSDTVDKWVFIKITDDTADAPVLYGAWVQCKAGQTVSFSDTFTLDTAASRIYFGIGGEMGDREDEAPLYELTDTKPSDVDPLYSTTLKLSNYSLAEVAAEEPSSEEDTQGGEEVTTKDNSGNEGGNEEATTKAPTSTTTPQTGDFSPIACAAVAIAAAAGIVVFTRKREEA